MVAVTEVETGRSFTVSTNTTQIVLNELHPFYTYTSAIAAHTVAPGPYSSEISVRLAEEGKKLCIAAIPALFNLLITCTITGV